MINKIWAFFIMIGVTYGLLTNRLDVVNAEVINSAKGTLDLILQLFPIMAVWLGLMNIALKSGLLNKISLLFTPILGKLFPDIPKGHEALSYIASNIVINMFGLGSAATPCGLKAMHALQELNPKKEQASKSMITFLVLNTAGVTLIPTTIIAMRAMYGSSSPTDIVLPCLLATSCASIAGLTLDYFIRRFSRD